MTDSASLWLARLEHDIDKVNDKLTDHATLPMHTGFAQSNVEMLKRLDRLETAAIKGMWALVGLLLSILGTLIAILFAALHIAQSKIG